MIKLIAVDMDGTLLNNEKHIADEQKKALKKACEAGVKIVLCTGRPLFGVFSFYKELDLENQDEYVILNNGCEIRETKDWTLTDYFGLMPEEISYLYNISKNYDVDFTLFDDRHYFCVGKKPNKYTVHDGKLVCSPITEITLEEAVSGKYGIFKGMYVGKAEEVARLQENLPKDMNKSYSICRSQEYILEIMPLGVNKGKALRSLAEHLKIKRNEIMAIGDGNNDIEMLEYAEFGIAMGNGTEAVKKAAKYITDTNEDNGVAKAIYRYIFNETIKI